METCVDEALHWIFVLAIGMVEGDWLHRKKGSWGSCSHVATLAEGFLFIQDIGIRTEILWVDTCKHYSYSHTNNSHSHKVYQRLSDTPCHHAVIGFGVGNPRKLRVSPPLFCGRPQCLLKSRLFLTCNGAKGNALSKPSTKSWLLTAPQPQT